MKNLHKPIFLIIMFSVFFSCQKQQGKIDYINLAISPIKSIDCDDLKLHPNKKKLILSEEENNQLVKLFTKLKTIKGSLDIDARVYGSVYNGSKK